MMRSIRLLMTISFVSIFFAGSVFAEEKSERKKLRDAVDKKGTILVVASDELFAPIPIVDFDLPSYKIKLEKDTEGYTKGYWLCWKDGADYFTKKFDQPPTASQIRDAKDWRNAPAAPTTYYYYDCPKCNKR